jgi:hypothetical protein
VALGGPNIYPGIAGCSYPFCRTEAQKNGHEAARRDLLNLLRKTRDHIPSARLAAVIAWAGGDLDQMKEMLPEKPWKIEGGWGGCAYSLDECPYDWCAVHDDLIVEDT